MTSKRTTYLVETITDMLMNVPPEEGNDILRGVSENLGIGVSSGEPFSKDVVYQWNAKNVKPSLVSLLNQRVPRGVELTHQQLLMYVPEARKHISNTLHHEAKMARVVKVRSGVYIFPRISKDAAE